MDVINKLSESAGRDERRNIALAEEIVATNDVQAVADLVRLLDHAHIKFVSGSIKTLYEIGERRPEMLADHFDSFIRSLSGKSNRLVWGAMIALEKISQSHPLKVYEKLNVILDAAEKGSVIAKDHAVKILVNIARQTEHSNDMQLLLIDILKSAFVNQFPFYAEQTASVVAEENKPLLIRAISDRMKDIEIDTKRKRLEKVLRKLQKK